MGTLRVLELYSGIGGMHYALNESGAVAEVVAAVDINTIANQVYAHNFPHTPLWSKTIEGIALDDFNRLQFDMILMSPPCQPFTRIGLQGDVSDSRAKSFLFILNLLPKLARCPPYILLENVKGFESSSARASLVQTLSDCGYTYQEFLLSPTCLGIPNSRLRYFLIAKTHGVFPFPTTAQILETFPGRTHSVCAARPSESEHSQSESVLYKLETEVELQRKRCQDEDESIRPLSEFLQPETCETERFLLAHRTLLRYCLLLDIVRPSCRRSVCFTKGYGHYVEGTGSVLQSCTDIQLEEVFQGLDSLCEEEKLKRLSKLKLRYFTPGEISTLMGFPASFSFPSHASIKQQYRLLGNSLNVHMVAKLIELMLA